MSLDESLDRIATVPVLLVASDYDGTIAPIVSDPSEAHPKRPSIVAIRSLSNLPQTHVAIISGRALEELARLTGMPEDVHLVGSHGSEFDPGFISSLSREAIALRDRLIEELSSVAAGGNGYTIEKKPAGVAFHYRDAPPEESERVIEELLEGPATIEGVFTKHGKKVLEFGVVSTNKGDALERVRHLAGASAVVFLGDDVTDEDAFATLTGPDVGIKVGEGETKAGFRVDGPDDVSRILAHLAEARAEWLGGSEAVPLEEHSFLSDQRTLAVVTPQARITWMCLPRLDSPALFAELLGGPAAGYFAVTPKGPGQKQQSYVGSTMVLKTSTPDVTVTDFLDCSGGRPGRRAGRSDLIRTIEGTGEVKIEFAPRLEFGRVPTRLQIRADGVEVGDTTDPIVLISPGVEWELIEEGPHQTAVAEVSLGDEPLSLELRYGSGSAKIGGASVEQRLIDTLEHWAGWADQLSLPEVEPDLVLRSAVLLKSLVYGPTGAIAAAATTSLPEHIGGVRNWDYRYSWLRDGAMSAAALVKLGSTSEAMEFLDWVLAVVDATQSPERLQPVYTVTGGVLPAEAEIGDLSGYRGSRPVRISNLASRQIQLDVFGPVVELVALLSSIDAPLSSEHWRLVVAMVRGVSKRWKEPDHGIWEFRGPRRHHIHSKVMCWLTVDRAISLAEDFDEAQTDGWKDLRDEIASDILQRGFDESMGAFTASYSNPDVDASTLWVGLSGLLESDDKRFLGTVGSIEKALLEGPTVYRYRSDDGLPGFEGGFHLCASWLVEAYLLCGRRDDAKELFGKIVELIGPTGTLSEQYGPKSKRALGNIPQAYSHIGLIENAIRLENALRAP